MTGNGRVKSGNLLHSIWFGWLTGVKFSRSAHCCWAVAGLVSRSQHKINHQIKKMPKETRIA